MLDAPPLDALGCENDPEGVRKSASPQTRSVRRVLPSCADEVYKVVFFMRHYQSPSMKPTMVITNNQVFADLDLGRAPKGKRSRAQPVTKRYTDGSGRTRFCGTSSLKPSQKHGLYEMVLFRTT